MNKFILFFLLLPLSVFALPQGKSNFRLKVTLDHAYKIRVFAYKPIVFNLEKTRVLIAIHGVNRDADVMRDRWQYLAETHNLLILVPKFDKKQFSNRMFQSGNVMKKRKVRNPENLHTYSIIEKVFVAAKKSTGLIVKKYYLYGSSAGGQFIHRFMLVTSHNNVKIAVAANSGYYTMPIETERFPYGLKYLNLPDRHIKKVLKRKVIVLLGEKDNDPNHKHLPRSKRIAPQGPHRLARGINFYRKLKDFAMNKNVELNWRLKYAPQIAHGGIRLVYTGARLLFGEAHAQKNREPLLKTHWDRTGEYTRHVGSKSLKSYAVAFAQIFHYFKQCPQEGCGTFDFNQMPDRLSARSTSTQINQVSKYLARVQKSIDRREDVAKEFNCRYQQHTTGRTSKRNIEIVIENAIKNRRPLVLNIRSKKRNYNKFIIDGAYRTRGQLYVHINSRSALFDGWYNFWNPIDEYDDNNYRRVIELIPIRSNDR